MSERFLNDRVELHCGDCREVLATLAENSLDACVTDPPYHLTSIVQRFGAENAAPAQFGSDGRYARASAGFIGRKWDGGDVAFRPETWAAVFRVLKPGAHLVAMGGTRTYHRLACAIEDAGFEIRDTVSWLYGSGFPKSHDVSKGIDRAAGMPRTEFLGLSGRHIGPSCAGDNGIGTFKEPNWQASNKVFAPATNAAREWAGWGTSLKPAQELICLARKPLSEGTIAANVLRWGTGAININACRVDANDAEEGRLRHDGGQNYTPVPDSDPTCRTFGRLRPDVTPPSPAGRWPANLLHDGSDEVVAAFPESGPGPGNVHTAKENGGGVFGGGRMGVENIFKDSGSAARFFYTAKADADDRLGSKHPTVKPLDLMQWLVRLVCPPKGTCLDPFAGTGTTGEAAWREGMRAVLIEAEAEYQADIRRRMALALSGPDERARESIKARNLPRDDGPLFGGIDQQIDGRTVYADSDTWKEAAGSRPHIAGNAKPRDDGPLFAGRETWAQMWAKPFDFSQEPRE